MAEIHVAIGLTGGGLALDGIRTATIADNDCCIVQMPDNICRIFRYESSESGAESSPDIIIPNDNISGTGAWRLQSVEQPGTDYGMGHWRYTTANGVDPGSASASGTIPMNDEVADEVTAAGPGTYPDVNYEVILPAGSYKVWGYASGYHTGAFRCKLYDDTGAADLLIGSSAHAPTTDANTIRSVFFGFITLAAPSEVRLDYYAEDTTSALLGKATGHDTIDEVHAELIVWSVD